MREVIGSLILSAVFLVLGLQAANTDASTAAQKAITQQVAKINEAWRSDDGAEIMADVLSDAFTFSMPDPREPGTWRTLNKEQFCTVFAQMLQTRRPIGHTRETSKITVRGRLAYEDGVSVHVTEQGTKRDRILNVWRQEGEQWLLLLSVDHTDLDAALDQTE